MAKKIKQTQTPSPEFLTSQSISEFFANIKTTHSLKPQLYLRKASQRLQPLPPHYKGTTPAYILDDGYIQMPHWNHYIASDKHNHQYIVFGIDEQYPSQVLLQLDDMPMLKQFIATHSQK